MCDNEGRSVGTLIGRRVVCVTMKGVLSVL